MANDYARTVADALIEQLREGVAPWQKPWDVTGFRFLPYNPTSGKDYRGMNAMWLLARQHASGFDDARWMTYKQAAAAGAQVRKGEKGSQVQYWKFEDRVPVKDAQGKPVKDAEGNAIMETRQLERPRVFTATVFNASQIDGLPPPEQRAQPSEWEREQRAEAILANSGADIRHQAGDAAFYMQSTDHIVLPDRGQFPESADYYGTALHELGHWTGHKSRLDRDLAHPFGSEGYAREELRAEISSLMLADRLGIPHKPDRHAAYVGSWIKALENDPREIFRAAADAEKIAGMLQGFEQQQAQEVDQVETIVAPIVTDPNEVAMTESERVYFEVPYAEKNDAKALGAKWDAQAKQWFAPPGADVAPLDARWSRAGQAEANTDKDPRVEFKEALKDAGLIVEGLPQMDGQLVRVKVEGDQGKERSGSYVGHSDGHPAGYINNFRTGHDAPWRASAAHAKALTASQRARLAAEATANRAKRERERDQSHSEVAHAIREHWDRAVPATADHPYLVSKDVPAYGVRVDQAGGLALPPGAAPEDQQSFSRSGSLLVPLHDMDGKLWAAQAIDGTGFKSLPKGGRYSGLHHLIGDLATPGPVLIAEGYATGADLHRETGLPVATAFSSNNLEAVARAYRERFPDRALVIAGDNDHRKPLELDAQGQPKPNVGREKAEAAAAAVDGGVMLPAFDGDDRGSDWNDLRRDRGQDAFAAQVRAGLASAQRHELVRVERRSRLEPAIEIDADRRQTRERSAIKVDEGRETRRARGR